MMEKGRGLYGGGGGWCGIGTRIVGMFRRNLVNCKQQKWWCSTKLVCRSTHI